jgi:DNA-binding beta-propeller fold protein YncE
MRARPLLLALLGLALADAANTAPLELESKISLGPVRGRIDHLDVDAKRRRLYVAELGDDSVGVVDLEQHKLLRTLTGLNHPQGVGYVASTDTLYVANGGDGSVRLFQGADLRPFGRIELGDDADNVRVDDAAHSIYVGYGNGALALIDTQSRRKVADIALKAHPEGFQLEPSGERIFINVPDRHEIAVVDRGSNAQIASWPTADLRANFPLALDEEQHAALAVFRAPAKLGAFSTRDGQLLSTADTCGDADDLFLDRQRNRLYVSCGEGAIDVLAAQSSGYTQSSGYKSIGRVATAAGARTALYVAGIDRLVLAVRSAEGAPAAIWVFRPAP